MQSLKEFSIYTKKILSVKDSYAIKVNANALGIDDKMLVENAGFAISYALLRKHRRKRILFVCGRGGKGAIGLATARHLLDVSGVNVSIAFLGDSSTISNEVCKFNYGALSSITEINDIGEENIDQLKKMLKSSDVVVEAILGIGMKGKIYGLLAHAIKMINESGKYIISIDVPAGIDADTGTTNIAGIKPSHVLTIHKLKAGIQKSSLIQSTTVEKIGIPISAEVLAGPGDLLVAAAPRLIDADKYSHGSVLIIGGSAKYKSAPLLASASASNAIAALRVGSGYATVMLPKGIDVPREGAYVSILSRNFKGESLSEEDLPVVSSIKHNVTIIGMGIDLDEVSSNAINKIVSSELKAGRIVVADAGAIKAVVKSGHLLTSNVIITPHYGEFKEISGIDLSHESLAAKVNAAINFAKDKGCVLVLKGNSTIITDGNLLKINNSATPALATMGTGDVLSGIIGAYASMHKDTFESAVAGVYLHSRIGDVLSLQKGNHVIVTDIIEAIPQLLRAYDHIIR
ncbi:MAG: NAD(P)H-hydrate dehydratase [Candidatus Micrarchaeia archaeon]